jgi:uncharacterized membrane protein
MRQAFLLLLLITVLHSVYVSGDIYEAGTLQRVNDTIVTVKSTTYSYRQVFSATNYSFSLPEGQYHLTAEKYGKDGTLTHSFNETVYLQGGSMRIDFVLLPLSSQNNLFFYALLVVMAVGGFLFYLFLVRHTKPVQMEKQQTFEPPKLDEDAKKVLDVIKANDCRITQKELRELLNFSDAK